MNETLYEVWFQNLPHSVIVVTTGLSIISTNALAEVLLSEGDALSRRTGVLSASHKPDQIFLNELAGPPRDEATGDEVAGDEAARNEVATFRSISGRPLVLATIAPLARDASRTEGRAFGITAWRATAAHERPLPDLRRLLGLTRAEASLVRPLLQGQTPQDIATDFNVSVETVRSHLKNAYAKAGVTNRSAFVSLLTALLP